MKKDWLVKTLALSVVVLFISMSTTFLVGSHSIKDNSGISLITLKVTGVTGGDNWYGSDNSFTFTYESDEIAEIYYGLDGNWELYNGTFNVAEGGNHTLEWYAVDYGGNQSEVDGPFNFKVDKTKPEADMDRQIIGNDRIGYETILTVTAVDSMIGMDHVDFYFNNVWQGTVYDPGPKYEWILWPFNTNLQVTMYAYAYDKAGNSVRVEYVKPSIQSNSKEFLSSKNVEIKNNKVNEKPPSNTASKDFNPAYVIVVFNREIGRNEWIKSNVSFSFFYEADRIDGVYYQLNNGSWILYTNPLVISEDGLYNFSWYVVDNEGNSSTLESVSFKVDLKPPEINLTRIYPDKINVKFIADVNDSTSGIAGGVRFQGPFDEIFDNVYPYEVECIARYFDFIVIATVCDNAGNYNSCTWVYGIFGLN